MNGVILIILLGVIVLLAGLFLIQRKSPQTGDEIAGAADSLWKRIFKRKQ